MRAQAAALPVGPKCLQTDFGFLSRRHAGKTVVLLPKSEEAENKAMMNMESGHR